MRKEKSDTGLAGQGELRIFNGAVAVVTGGASGIGAALSRELAKRGCEVVLADRQIGLAQQVAAQIHAAGGKAAAAELDVTEFNAVEALVRDTALRTGRLDYMFNNAGIGISGPAAVHALEDWEESINVNLRGVIHGVQAAYRVMREQGWGHIVNTASLAGLLSSPGSISYAATKHAVVGLSKTLRVEAAPSGIRVSVLCPGFIRTPILEQGGKYGKVLIEYPPELQAKIKQFVEKQHPMPPEAFAVKALAAVARNEAIIVLPGRYKLMWWFDRLFPDWHMRVVTKKFMNAFK